MIHATTRIQKPAKTTPSAGRGGAGGAACQVGWSFWVMAGPPRLGIVRGSAPRYAASDDPARADWHAFEGPDTSVNGRSDLLTTADEARDLEVVFGGWRRRRGSRLNAGCRRGLRRGRRLRLDARTLGRLPSLGWRGRNRRCGDRGRRGLDSDRRRHVVAVQAGGDQG